MTTLRRTMTLAAGAACCVGTIALAGAQQGAEQLTVSFSDPNRPGTVEIEVITGSITVRGSNRKDVLITARPRAGEPPRLTRPDASAGGLRRLPQVAGFSVEERDNVMEIESAPVRWLDFDVQVPARTNLELSLVQGAAMTVENVEGDIEVQNVNGPITLTNVAGTIVADSVNGPVVATLSRVAPDKPMAFTSLNGAVDVTLPAAVKASFRLRSDQGEIYTDFDLQLRAAAAKSERSGRGGTRIEVNRDVIGDVNGGGPEFELRTFHGHIYLRKAGQ